jgi:hypothetical protein
MPARSSHLRRLAALEVEHVDVAEGEVSALERDRSSVGRPGGGLVVGALGRVRESAGVSAVGVDDVDRGGVSEAARLRGGMTPFASAERLKRLSGLF